MCDATVSKSILNIRLPYHYICCIASYCTLLYCTALYCNRFYCILLYFTVLYCTVLYCTILHCNVMYCNVLYCAIQYCIVLYYTVLCCAVLCCTTLYCTVLHRTVPYCTAFCKVRSLFNRGNGLMSYESNILFFPPLAPQFALLSEVAESCCSDFHYIHDVTDGAVVV